MIQVVGIGPGNKDLLTPQAHNVIQDADFLFGWNRALSLFEDTHADKIEIGCDLVNLIGLLKKHNDSKCVVLASGDPLLFGIGKKIGEEFGRQNVEFISGISSVQYFFSRIGLDMNDIYITSCHGQVPNYDFIARLDKVALVTDKFNSPYKIAQEMLSRGVNCTMYVGENLAYPEECIETYQLSHALPPKDKNYQLNVVVLKNERQ
ncbi:precorrin-6y C5,15-methyltransferase (decarboxylating) subunit CbiE [Vibrio viridaestus]|uniref:Precorrin-6y C5,15-methyltransferase (Decarboxylating) subunit CbiE n=1 Tax=Vibrio viridaestus TaxID=2487322 RepID=A0A3N9TJV6_9VIBR|nr:precorrin-6y C5,15-methyltransferase (decarboxylating) subunit CbiE [Vibrio viridaestus]RQW64557.1 precorrin-6y C5,15-methyltransferase (decarboxylating) subunit CbiE [Vibrio viridaestus]